MITEKQYLKALDIIKMYEKQKTIKKEDNSDIALLDDMLFIIEISGIEFCLVNYYEFKDCLDIILSKKQMDKFIAIDTEREFKVSKNSISKIENYISKSIWRKK